MTLKKTAKSKRANPPREFSRTKEFKKDWQRLTHSGRYDMNRLKEAMLLLIENTVPLPPEWLDHALAGNWTNHREWPYRRGMRWVKHALHALGQVLQSRTCVIARPVLLQDLTPLLCVTPLCDPFMTLHVIRKGLVLC